MWPNYKSIIKKHVFKVAKVSVLRVLKAYRKQAFRDCW